MYIYEALTCCDQFETLYIVFQMVVGLFSGSVSAAATLSIVAVVVYGARLTILGQMTTGTLTAFILYSLTGSWINFKSNHSKKW